MLVDTKILIEVLGSYLEWSDWSVTQLQAQSMIHRLVINPIIDSELLLTFSTLEALDQVLEDMELSMLEIPEPALFLAGKAFVQYRHTGGEKNAALGVFYWRPCHCQRPAGTYPRYSSL